MTYDPDDADTPHTVDDRLDMAGDWLAEAGMRLIIDTDSGHRYDAWNAAEAEFGQAIALIHAPGGHIPVVVKVHWWYGDSAYAGAVVDAFTKAGCTATWDGKMFSAVHVDLNI